MKRLALLLVSALVAVGWLAGVPRVARAASQIRPMSDAQIYQSALVLLLHEHPELIQNDDFVRNYGLIFGCSGRTFDQVTIHEPMARWRGQLRQLARRPAPRVLVVPFHVRLKYYDYERQIFPMASFQPNDVAYSLSSYQIQSSCEYKADSSLLADMMAEYGVLPLIVVTIDDPDAFHGTPVPRGRAEIVLHRMGGTANATYLARALVESVDWYPTMRNQITDWPGNPFFPSRWRNSSSFFSSPYTWLLHPPFKGILHLTVDVTGYAIYPGAQRNGSPLAVWRQPRGSDTDGAGEAAVGTGGAAPRAARDEGPAGLGPKLSVALQDVWVTLPSAVDSPFAYAHARVILLARSMVEVRSDQLRAVVVLPNGGSTVVSGLAKAAPGYYHTDLYGNPIYTLPLKPSVAPSEDLGAIGSVYLVGGQSAAYVVTFQIPPADVGPGGQVRIARILWNP